MTTKASVTSRPAAPPFAVAPWTGFSLTPPCTMEQRLQRIEAMGQRIASYIQFMGQVAGLNGTSAEAKERAVTNFYERLLVAERQLGRIQEDLQLG